MYFSLLLTSFFLIIGALLDVGNAQACGGDMSRQQGQILSPTYRTMKRYSNNLFCVWNLQFTEYDSITIAFRDMQMENGGTCKKDYVKLAFSDKPAQTLCGFNVPRARFSGAGPANVTFVSDAKTVYRGFYLQYMARETACKSLPCQNGGTCENLPPPAEGYKCSCPENYSGDNCEIEPEVIDEPPPELPKYCESEPCQNDGTCTEVNGGYECQCTSGWEGKDCETDFDECASGPCQNGGICENLSDEYRCQCESGWTGFNCEEDLNECASDPCKNQGTCENLSNEYRCQCVPGWTGSNCEEDIDECQSNPCKNQGTCENLANEYRCQCAGGWTGVNCVNDVNECASNPCRNGGTCENSLNKYTCRCKPGWTGVNCMEDADDCIPNPCKNGGVCRDAFNDFRCTCKDQWTGKTCEDEVELTDEEEEEEEKQEKVEIITEEQPVSDDPCNPSPCLHEGECHDMGDGTVFCLCQDGFNGDFCEEGSNVCIPNPCQNEGRCVKWGDSFTCTCASGWEGDDCSKNINECQSNPCSADLVCVDLVNSYKCREECDPGYTGEDCDVEINECDSEPCMNNATCKDDLNAFSCECNIGFSGVLCDDNNPCEGAPCRNGGTCHESSSTGRNSTGFICACQLGWTGITCEKIVEHGCRNPDESSEGLVPYGVSLEFFCEVGFNLSGPAVITCQDTGEFSYAVPECIAIGSSSSAVNISAQTLKSPMVLSMLVAGGLIVIAIAAFLLYLFVCAPWNSSTAAVAASPIPSTC